MLPQITQAAHCIIIASCIMMASDARSQSHDSQCSGFEDRSNLREVLITGDARPDELPVFDVMLRFPASDTSPTGSPKTARVLDGVLIDLPFKVDNAGMIHILLHDRKFLSEVVNINVSFRTKTSLDMVQKHMAARLTSSSYELMEVMGTSGVWARDHMYLAGDPDKWSDMITCSKAGTVPNPNCKHHFDVGHIDVDMFYNRRMLPEWRAIRKQVESYVSCAIVDSWRIDR